MSPICAIGRYQLPILSVVAIIKRQETGWRGLLVRLKLAKPGYDAVLTNGHFLHFTEIEKQLYDEAMESHAITMQVYGMCRGLGLRT